MSRILIYISVAALCFACDPSDPSPDNDHDYEPITPSPPETEIRTDPLLSPRTYAGTINDQGYYPPDNVQVVWKRPGSATVFKTLNRGIPWSGSNAGDDAGYFGRYANSDTSVRGAQIASIGSEQKGGEASAILTVLLGRPPSNQELYDFAIANSPSSVMGCSAWVSITGTARVGCTDTGSGGGTSGLRKQPVNPIGCCSKTLPCEVDDPVRDRLRKVGERWVEPVETSIGGRRGCNLIKVGEEIVTPTPSVTPTPVPTPTPTPAPSAQDRCWLLRMREDGSAILSSIPCP